MSETCLEEKWHLARHSEWTGSASDANFAFLRAEAPSISLWQGTLFTGHFPQSPGVLLIWSRVSKTTLPRVNYIEHLFNKLDVALAKCQRATIQNKY